MEIAELHIARREFAPAPDSLLESLLRDRNVGD